ncbi:MAG TPA: peptidyl-prolyl cis-trans isomerase [Anaeromyxobacteraceae bacterium]|nr:peptidyl-prolyl cis-trans isomerase [Anaeromyxobacteraceae bacterium]
MRSRALLLLAAAGLSAGCGRCGSRPPAPKTGPRAVAVVNGETITAEALKRELDHARAAGAEGGSPDGVLRRRLLEDAVERALLLQQAHARSITVGQDQIERALLRVRADYPGSHFDDLLAQERLSQAELKTRLKEQLTVEKLFADEVFPGVQVTEADVARHYAEHAADFEQPQQVRASQIVVRTREEAQKLREELRRRPRSFADVAARASLSPEGKAGGDLGWFGKGSGMPEVFDACFKLPLNAVSEVTPSPYGFHLFKVTARRPAQRRPLDEVRPVIYDKLLREGRAGAQETYLAALRKKAQIQIDEAALGAVAP